MSSQKTEHYELNQWQATDQVLRTDFNADNAKIDGALAEKAQAADLEALSSTVSGLSATLNTEISQRQAADNGLQTALAAKGNCQVYYGTYTGTGAGSTYLSFPARPLMVTIMGGNNWLTAVQGNPDAMYKNGGAGAGKVNATWSGSAVTFQDDRVDYHCNISGQVYRVVAVMDLAE